jgi:hypothetical protein
MVSKLKAQSAMEYLMTYGWAILIVIIVAAALFSLGVFNPASYTGRIPTGFTTLGAPDDWKLGTTGDFDIILTNRLATQITVSQIDITLKGTSTTDGYTPSPAITIAPGSTSTLTAATSGLNLGTQTAGTTYTLEVAVTYNAGGFDQVETGTLTDTVS